MYGVKLLIQ